MTDNPAFIGYRRKRFVKGWPDELRHLNIDYSGYRYNHVTRVAEDVEAFLGYTEHLIDHGAHLYGSLAIRDSHIEPLMRMAGSNKIVRLAPGKSMRITKRFGLPGGLPGGLDRPQSKNVHHEPPVELPMVAVVADGLSARLLYTRSGWLTEPLPRQAAIRLAAILNPTTDNRKDIHGETRP